MESQPSSSEPINESLQQYIATLTEKEYQGYLIARSHLRSSFNLEKSLGFIEWIKQQPIPLSASLTPCNP